MTEAVDSRRADARACSAILKGHQMNGCSDAYGAAGGPIARRSGVGSRCFQLLQNGREDGNRQR